MLNSKKIISESGIQFGTSGARGLVIDLTPQVCIAFTLGFLNEAKKKFDFKSVAVAIDNRPSSYAIAQAAVAAINMLGYEATFYGVIPTPALAYTAMQDSIPCIMVTGSHIPFDRNGLKFYYPDGEISKSDEQAIINAQEEFQIVPLPCLQVSSRAAEQYVRRYTDIFSCELLTGMRIGIYEHSSAGRDLYKIILESLGATAISLERSNEFIPIDTEAVSIIDREKARRWSMEHQLDLIISTDGDGDRPLVADEHGEWLRGDILGLLAAKALNIEALAIPVSCNSAIDSSESFNKVLRTKIGSPYVISGLAELNLHYSTFAGFEANGGFLLGSDIEIEGKILKALPTRDAVLPILALFLLSKDRKVSKLVERLSLRFTDSDRIQDFPTEQSEKILTAASGQETRLLNLLGFNDVFCLKVDVTDGLRLLLNNGDIIHLRPSGNAPELRCYAESSSVESAGEVVKKVLENIININIDIL